MPTCTRRRDCSRGEATHNPHFCPPTTATHQSTALGSAWTARASGSAARATSARLCIDPRKPNVFDACIAWVSAHVMRHAAESGHTATILNARVFPHTHLELRGGEVRELVQPCCPRERARRGLGVVRRNRRDVRVPHRLQCQRGRQRAYTCGRPCLRLPGALWRYGARCRTPA